MELLAFASRQFAPNYGPLSVPFIHLVFFFFEYYFLVSERSGRKPSAERRALYFLSLEVTIISNLHGQMDLLTQL